MNGKFGQAMLVGLMIFCITFIAATMMMPSLFSIVDVARTDLNCELDNLTTGNASVCVLVGITPAFFLAVVIASGASFVTSRITGG